MDESKTSEAAPQAEVYTLTLALSPETYRRLQHHYARYCELPEAPRLSEAEFAASALNDVLGLLDVLEEQSRRVVGPGDVITVPKFVPPRELRGREM